MLALLSYFSIETASNRTGQQNLFIRYYLDLCNGAASSLEELFQSIPPRTTRRQKSDRAFLKHCSLKKMKRVQATFNNDSVEGTPITCWNL